LTEKRGGLLGLGISNVDCTPPSMCDDIYGLDMDGLGGPSIYDQTFDSFEHSDPFLSGLYNNYNHTAGKASVDLSLPFDLDWIKDASLATEV
jgi:hypothetical protein